MIRNAIASKAKKRRAGIACKTLKRPKLLARPKMAAAFLGVFALCGCASLRRAAAPVAVFDARITGQASPVGDAILGVEFVAANLSGRPVKSVTVFVSVQEREEDSGQEDDCGGAFYERRFVLDGGLDAGQEETFFVPLEDAPPDCDEDALEIQSLYVESAEYEDGGAFP